VPPEHTNLTFGRHSQIVPGLFVLSAREHFLPVRLAVPSGTALFLPRLAKASANLSIYMHIFLLTVGIRFRNVALISRPSPTGRKEEQEKGRFAPFFLFRDQAMS
jgi:hypothetical protein